MTTAYDRQKKRIEYYRAHPEKIPAHAHGSINGYNNYGCNCDACKGAWSQWCKDAQERRASKPIPDHVHGTENGYGNYKCRCDGCRAAWTKGTNERAKRRRERLAEQKAR